MVKLAAQLCVTIIVMLGATRTGNAELLSLRGGPTDCQDLTAVPPFTQISYSSNVQAVFTLNCAPCHFDGGNSGGLNLDPANSFTNLLTAAGPSPARVIPNDPLGSLLFLKVNCDNPGVGSRMPQGASPLSAAQQALIFDWIRLGAPLLRSGFEDR